MGHGGAITLAAVEVDIDALRNHLSLILLACRLNSLLANQTSWQGLGFIVSELGKVSDPICEVLGLLWLARGLDSFKVEEVRVGVSLLHNSVRGVFISLGVRLVVVVSDVAHAWVGQSLECVALMHVLLGSDILHLTDDLLPFLWVRLAKVEPAFH